MYNRALWHHHLWKVTYIRHKVFILLVIFVITSKGCVDGPMCSYMAHMNECELFPEEMLRDCPRACKNVCVCDMTGVSDDTACDCLVKAKNGYCELPESKVDCATTCSDTVNGPCPLLDPPNDPNAQLSTWSTSFLTTVTEVCNAGYHPLDSNSKGQKTCVAGGVWHSDMFFGSSVVCVPLDCGNPPTSPHTDNFYMETVHGSTADYSCVQGYSPISGQATLTCGDSGTWEGQLLHCERATTCNQPPASDNATVTVSGTTVGETAQYACVAGYEVSAGNTTLTCGSAGTWEGNVIVCSPVNCGSPPQPPHTVVTSSGDTTYTSATNYSCSNGFQPEHGDSTLTCDQTGNWTGQPLSCVPVDCGQPPISDNSTVTNTGTQVGDTASYTCDLGHQHTQGDSTLTCGDSGQWQGQLIVCTAVECGPPPSPDHTQVTAPDTSYGHTATYSCLEGYEMVTGDPSLTCGANGGWSGTPLQCAAIDCMSPPGSTNSDVQFTGTTYGNTANYSCRVGHIIATGDASLTCGSNGSWIGQPLQCGAIDCSSPPASSNANVSVTGTTYQHSASYTCHLGYSKSGGDSILTCAADGTWAGQIVQCSLVDCANPPSLAHTSLQVTDTTYGQTATYSCQVGYNHEQGEHTLTCGPSGMWLGDHLQCSIVDCGQPPKSVGVSVDRKATTFDSTANYSCQTGYQYLSGDTTLICQASGSWQGQAMTCQIKDCGRPDVRNSTQISYTTTTYGSRASYSCDLGHERVDGDRERTCLASQTWSGNALVCLPVVCGPPPVFAGAREWTLDGDGHHTYTDRIHYECFYEEEGREGLQWVMECGPDSVWVGQEPQCGAANPHKAPSFSPEPEEAPASWAIGVGIFALLASGIILFIILDIAAIRKHSKYMRKNIRNFGKNVMKRWKNFRSGGNWNSTGLKPAEAILVSPTTMPIISPAPTLTFNNVLGSPHNSPTKASNNQTNNNNNNNTSNSSNNTRTSTILQDDLDLDTMTPVNTPTPSRREAQSLSSIRLSSVSQPENSLLGSSDALANNNINNNNNRLMRPAGGSTVISRPTMETFTSSEA